MPQGGNMQAIVYTVCFKLKAVECALENGNHAARRHFGIDEVRIRYWRQQHKKLFEHIIWSDVQTDMRHTTIQDTWDVHSNERAVHNTALTWPLSIAIKPDPDRNSRPRLATSCSSLIGANRDRKVNLNWKCTMWHPYSSSWSSACMHWRLHTLAKYKTNNSAQCCFTLHEHVN